MTAPKATASTKTDDATSRAEVESVKQLAVAGKVAVVTLTEWPPASALGALTSQLLAATGNAPVIVPPGAKVQFQAKAD